MRKSTSLMLALMLTTAMPQAYAATVDAKGAATLKKQVEDSMSFSIAAAKAKVAAGLTLGGDIEVTPKNGFYEVKIPNVVFSSPKSYSVKIGTLVANMSPADDGAYATTLALPSPMEFDDADGQKVGTLTIGSQHFTGTWRPDLGGIMNVLDAEYKDVSFTATGKMPFTIAVKDIKSAMKLAKDGTDTWSGPLSTDITGVTSNIQTQDSGTIDASIAHASALYTVDKMNLKARQDAREKITALLNQSDTAKPTPEQAGQISQAILQSAASFMNAMDNAYTLENVDVKMTPKAQVADAKDKTPPKPQSPTHIVLAKFTSHTTADGLQANDSKMHVTLGFSGLSVDDGTKDALSGTMPTTGNVDVALSNIPIKTIAGVFSQAAAQAVQSEFDQQDEDEKPGQVAFGSAMRAQAAAQFKVALLTLPLTLANAGTNIVISNTHMDAPDLKTVLDAKFTANTASPLHAVGNLVLSFTGLDELLQRVQAIAQSPDSSPRLMTASQWLMMIQMMGQVEKAPDGKSMRVFKIDLTQDGQALLNGKPMSAGLGAAGSMIQAQQPPKTAPETPTPKAATQGAPKPATP